MQSQCLPVHTSVCPFVHPQNAFQFEQQIWQVQVDEWYTMVCRMTWSKVKVKVMEVWNVQKMANFKVDLLHQYACNQKTNGELWYSETVSKF